MMRRSGPYLALLIAAVVAAAGEDQPRATGEPPSANDSARVRDDRTTASPPVPYQLDWVSINSGGVVGAAAGNLRFGASAAQHAAGLVASPTHTLGIGFWYGIATPCDCDCHADPKCDGVTNVFDVVLAVDVAFRSEPEIPDSNALCPRMTTDVDCDGVTKVYDVVHLVNVAFRGGNAATEFCNPCGP
ncbi:MAG: hypothetical protein AB1792_11190 [Candidatus Zixiibacteriota bacterium]